MPIDNERYERILGTAVARAQKAFDRTFQYAEYDNGKWSKSKPITIDDYFRKVQDRYEKNFGEIGAVTRNSVFAASHVLQAVYGACACEQIKSELDKIFNEKDNELLDGVTDKEKAALCQEMKDVVDKQVPGEDKLDLDGSLAEESKYIATVFQLDQLGGDDDVLQDCVSSIDWMINQFLTNQKTPSNLPDIKEDIEYPNKPKNDVNQVMMEAVENFAAKFSKTLENIDDDTLVEYTPIIYDKHNANNNINPKKFLEHYKKDPDGLTGLSDKEKEWASQSLDAIISDLHNTYDGLELTDKQFRSITRKNNISFDLENFMVDDETIVPEGEAESNPKNASARIMGALLDGKDVVANPIGDDGELLQEAHVAPRVKNRTEKTFWDSVWELIQDFLEAIGISTERKELKEFIEGVNQTNAKRDALRDHVPFDELNKTGKVFNKATKEPQKEQPAKELNGPGL